MLQSNNLAYQAIEIDKLNTNPVIQDLLALTKALLHPADKIAWLAVMRAPWCGLSLKDLYVITNSSSRGLTAGSSDVKNFMDPAVKPRDDKSAPQDDTATTIWQSINDPDVLQKLDESSRQNLLFLRDNLAVALQNRGRKNLRNLIYDAWLSINGDACLTKNSDIEDVKTYFKLLETFDAGGDIKNFVQFEEKIDTLYTSPAATNDDTLQVMTIHKAKGLEFDVVILPGMHHMTRNADKQLLLWAEQPRPESGDELILAPIKNHAHQEDKIYNYLAHHEKQKNHLETMRLLYVAVTRAKHQLHLFGTLQNKEPKKGSFLSLIWPKVKEQFATAQKTLEPHAPQKSQHKFKRIVRDKLLSSRGLTAGSSDIKDFKVLDPINLVREDDKPAPRDDKPAPRDDTNANIGTIIHRILQQISIDGIDQWPEKRIKNATPYWQNMLTQLGVSSKNLKHAIEQIHFALKNILSDVRGRWILTKHQEHSTELAISTTENNQLKRYAIDRTFVDENHRRWIIDYKTTSFTEKNLKDHQKQLANYHKLLVQLYPGKICCGLYYPIISKWEESPFE
jgi:RPE4 domain-containing protein